jgi:hypothetical protein
VNTTSGTDTLIVFHDGTTGTDAIVLRGVTDVGGFTIG